MRALFTLAVAVVATLVLLPRGCHQVREHVLLSLIRESERPVEMVDREPMVFRFPATPVRAVALIDLQDAATPDGHVSFLPAPGSERYAWAAGLCRSWSTGCLESRPATTLTTLTYGETPPGLEQIEPVGRPPATLRPGRLYGLALFGDKLFLLKVFYRDAGGIHVMEGARFTEAVTRGRRDEIRAFLDAS